MSVTNGAKAGESIEPIKTLSKVYLFGKHPDTTTVTFHFVHKKPNAWHRFWQKLLLGWVWEDEQ